jgi:hypothetical protein
MNRRFVFAVLLAFSCAGCLCADLKRALTEPNLEKRSKLAMDNAKAAYQAAREAYQNGDLDRVKVLASEIEESVALAYQSLEQTGKNPRSNPRYFKSAEQETSQLARRIEGFQEEMSYTERPMLDQTKARVQEVHDKLLLGLMEGKKK